MYKYKFDRHINPLAGMQILESRQIIISLFCKEQTWAFVCLGRQEQKG